MKRKRRASLKLACALTMASPALTAAQSPTTQMPRIGLAWSDCDEPSCLRGLAELSAERLQLVTELLPGASRIGVLWNAANRVKVLDFEVTRDAALSLGKEIVSLPVSGAPERAPAFEAARQRRIRLDADPELMSAGERGEAAALLEEALERLNPTPHDACHSKGANRGRGCAATRPHRRARSA
jgi:ABC-type uncharacterized transport system substrate-binding protein